MALTLRSPETNGRNLNTGQPAGIITPSFARATPGTPELLLFVPLQDLADYPVGLVEQAIATVAETPETRPACARLIRVACRASQTLGLNPFRTGRPIAAFERYHAAFWGTVGDLQGDDRDALGSFAVAYRGELKRIAEQAASATTAAEHSEARLRATARAQGKISSTTENAQAAGLTRAYKRLRGLEA